MRWGTIFKPGQDHIQVVSTVVGPRDRRRIVDSVFDTGTPVTILQQAIAATVGLGPEKGLGPCQFRGVRGVERGYWVRVPRLQALGRTWEDFQAACLPMDEDMGVECLLGLDLLTRLVVTVDFKRGTIELEE